MNLKQARYMKTIAQEGSITAAAKKLYVSQPSLSQMLRQVETELGLPIFDRSVSPFRLTYAGEQYLRTAQIMLAAAERLENQLREIKQENTGRLRLGISVQRAMQVLPAALPRFWEQYPSVSVELTEAGSTKLEDMVRDGRLDMALAAIASASPHLTYELIEQEVIGILAGAGSHLAQTQPAGTLVTLEDAREDTFISLKQGHSVRLVQDTLFRTAGIRTHILLESDSMEVAKRVALGTGSCLLCSNIYMDSLVRRKGGAFYPLKNYENKRHFYVCYRKDEYLPRYMRDFIQITSEVLSR